MRVRRTRINTISFFAFQDIITSVVGIFVLITLIMILELVQTKAGATDTRVRIPEEMLVQINELETEFTKLESLRATLQTNAAKASSRNAFSVEQERSGLQSQVEEIQSQLSNAQRRSIKLSEQLEAGKRLEKHLVSREGELAKLRKSSQDSAAQLQDAAAVSAILEVEKPLVFRDKTEQGRHVVLIVLEQGKINVSDAMAAKSYSFSSSAMTGDFADWLSGTDLDLRQFLLIVKPSGQTHFEGVTKILRSSSAVYGFDVAGEDQRFRLLFQLRGK